MTKKHKKEEEYPTQANESDSMYAVNEQVIPHTDEIPLELLNKLVERALMDVKNGKCYTTEQAMALLDQKLGWK